MQLWKQSQKLKEDKEVSPYNDTKLEMNTW